ncbi:MAG: hypothetical protein WCW84_10395 [Sulfurimonas sp.]|jgi:hypothetical protein
METRAVAQWIFGIVVFLGGILAIGKLLAQHDEQRGYCNIYPKASKKKKETLSRNETNTNTEKPL